MQRSNESDTNAVILSDSSVKSQEQASATNPVKKKKRRKKAKKKSNKNPVTLDTESELGKVIHKLTNAQGEHSRNMALYREMKSIVERSDPEEVKKYQSIISVVFLIMGSLDLDLPPLNRTTYLPFATLKN